MRTLKNFLISFMLFFILTSCGYTPIALERKNLNINIEILEYEGDYKINSTLRSKLSIHKNNQSGELYKISIKTEYEKKDLSKDASGNIENYELIAYSTIEIIKDEQMNKVRFNEKFTMENFTDDFEEENYEKKIKETFAESIYDKLISYIFQIK